MGGFSPERAGHGYDDQSLLLILWNCSTGVTIPCDADTRRRIRRLQAVENMGGGKSQSSGPASQEPTEGLVQHKGDAAVSARLLDRLYPFVRDEDTTAHYAVRAQSDLLQPHGLVRRQVREHEASGMDGPLRGGERT
jgi:hypothetical protein